MSGKHPFPSGTRPLTEAERYALSPPPLQAGCLAWGLLAIGGWLICSLMFTGVCVRTNHLSLLESPWFLIIILVIWICISVALSRWQKGRQANVYAALRDRAATEVAHVYSFSAIDAIQVEEFEDEGSSYFLRLANGEVLFLTGQYLYDYEESRRFPCSDFDVVRRSGLDYVLEVVCRGKYITPSKISKPFRLAQFEAGTVPEDMHLVDVQWEEIETRYS